MKIEIGENLFYSWLRHVKECQIVQTNWKVSPQWTMQHTEQLEQLMTICDQHYSKKYGYNIFKQNTSLFQVIRQGECDVLGISIQQEKNSFYAVDVAFHEAGLNYGSRETTVMKVIAKTIRTAMCLYGYMDCTDAEIVFASPKINPTVLNNLIPCIAELNELFHKQGYSFHVRMIANEEFNASVLQPILLVSDGISDTSELFLRSYQMYTMFSTVPTCEKLRQLPQRSEQYKTTGAELLSYTDEKVYQELKIGKLAQTVFRKLLEHGSATEEEIAKMQTAGYSKDVFHLQYPVLVKTNGQYDSTRYYRSPLVIRGVSYRMCSQWFEGSANNDRPFLISWILTHD